MPLPIRSSMLRVILAAALLSTSALAQSTPPSTASADETLAQLKSQAVAGHKKILLSFGASWCGNCRLFDKFLADPTIHPILDRVFVFADLAAGELPGDKRHANVPGAEKLQASLGGKEAGLPFIVMLHADGAPIANSLRPLANGGTDNIGYPDAPYEIDWFMEMLKKAAPSLAAPETTTIRKWLKTHSSTPH